MHVEVEQSNSQLESQDDDSMTMCLSKSQDDDSMVCFSIEKHGIRRFVGACVRDVLKERACETC
jgi:hypothetical protein